MASGEDPSEMNVDLLKCGVCLERYRRPKLLPCFHTYCQQCVEKMADTKPSFACPACRTVVVIPPGGAAALQANFYLEKDLTKQEAKEGRECQLCTKGKQAQYKCMQCRQAYCAPCRDIHDSIESCTQHTLLAVGDDALARESEGEGAAVESKCPKHKNQMLLLFCCRCEVSICMQCKLTSHEGHETEDVVDAGMKAKAQLKEEYDVLDQHRQLLEAVLAKTDDYFSDLDKEKQAAMEEIRERTSQLQDMVSQVQEKAMETVHTTAEMAVADLKEQANPLNERHAAIVAKRQHIRQIMDEGNADDAVSLLAKLRGETGNEGKKNWVPENLAIQRGTVRVGHRPKAVKYSDLVSFVGTAKEGPVVETKPMSLGALLEQGQMKRSLKQASQSKYAVARQKIIDREALSFTEFLYSYNPAATFQRMCLTSDGGFWVMYNPGGSVQLMSLFDNEGLCLETLYENVPTYNPVITCDENTALSLGNGMWAKRGGETGTLYPSPNRNGATVSKTLTPFIMWPNGTYRNILRITSVSPMPPVIDNNPVCTFTMNGTYNFDVSADERFYAFTVNPVYVYDKIQSTPNLRQFGTYQTAHYPTDVCFCEMEGQEVLLVAYSTENSVHVVDHRDGCCLLRKLETDGCKLDRPAQLATNHQGRVWVGCQGGKIVAFDL